MPSGSTNSWDGGPFNKYEIPGRTSNVGKTFYRPHTGNSDLGEGDN